MLKKMKILYYISGLGYGGKERQLSELVKCIIEKRNIKLEIVSMTNDLHYESLKSLRLNGLKIHFLNRKYRKDFSVFKNLITICKTFSPDIIHTWDSMASIYAAPIAKKMNIKFVNGMIRDAPIKLNLLKKNWLRAKLTFPFSDIIISNSRAGIKSYNAPLKKSICIYNGFDLDRIKNINNKKKIIEEHKICTRYVVGMVANFSEKKDYGTFIKATNMIAGKRNDVTFLLIGEGPTRERYMNSINYNLKKRIKFLGKQENVEEIINIFDVGVLTTFGEGLSNSIMEYMALGKPVLANYGGGTNELLKDGKTGFLLKSRDAKDICKKLDILLDDNELALKMGRAGHERITKYFNIDIMKRSYINMYNRLNKI